MIDLYYLGELRKIRLFLERSFRDFELDTNGHCCRTSRLIKRVVPDLDQVAGDYVPKGVLVMNHCWNVDRKRERIIDLARDRLDQGDGISILPIDSDCYRASLGSTLIQRAITLLDIGRDKNLLRDYNDFRSKMFSKSALGL